MTKTKKEINCHNGYTDAIKLCLFVLKMTTYRQDFQITLERSPTLRKNKNPDYKLWIRIIFGFEKLEEGF